MRSLAPIVVLGLVCLGADAARVTSVVRTDRTRRVELASSARPAPALGPILDGGDESAGRADKIDVLNCESDGTISPSRTLPLVPGDLAGTMYDVASATNPYRIAELHLGIYDPGSTYPTRIEILILEADAAGEVFDGIASFTIGIDGAIATGGEILAVDLRIWEVTGRNDLLILFGGVTEGVLEPLLPAGDDSPRCATENLDNVCSYVLPPVGNLLYIYGEVDAETCPDTGHHVFSHDVVLEVLLESPGTPVEAGSFGGLKGRY